MPRDTTFYLCLASGFGENVKHFFPKPRARQNMLNLSFCVSEMITQASQMHWKHGQIWRKKLKCQNVPLNITPE